MGKSGIKWQAVTKAEAKKCVLLSSSLPSAASLNSQRIRVLTPPRRSILRLASLDDEEGLVYRAIEQAGRDGTTHPPPPPSLGSR